MACHKILDLNFYVFIISTVEDNFCFQPTADLHSSAGGTDDCNVCPTEELKLIVVLSHSGLL